MATLQASGFLQSSAHSAYPKNSITAILDIPKSRTKSNSIFLPKNLQIGGLAEVGFSSLSPSSILLLEKQANSNISLLRDTEPDPLVVAKLYAILEAVADRVEMHKNIGKQREEWNSLLLTSINAITLTAATMSGIAATSFGAGASLAALKLSSTLMFLGATGMLLVMNKIQPSQLVEEQRNAARFFQQLHNQIQTILSIGNPTERDVKEAMDKVLALDKAYPLPLLGVMLEKFPSKVKPAVWWPQHQQREANEIAHKTESNGWDLGLEKEMRSIVEVFKRKDEAEYLRLGGKALKFNKLCAVSGPLLTAIAAIGSALLTFPFFFMWLINANMIRQWSFW